MVSSSSADFTAEGLTKQGRDVFVLGGSKAGRLKDRMDFAKIAADLSSFVWGVPLIALLFGTHLFLTVRTGFIQRFLPRAIKLSFSREKEGEGDVSQFAALMTALAATIGTGNIVGVSSAIAVGGPGAVMWMWLTGVFGIATKYSEALLAVKYRVQMPDGSMAGGPMYALERGLGQKWLGVVFAVFTMVAAFGIGCMTQANSVVANVNQLLKETAATGASWAQPQVVAWTLGLIMTVATAVTILGGVKSIARVCEKLVPFMAVFYILGCLGVLIVNWQALPESIAVIVKSAFTGTAAAGGFVGAGVRLAMQKGIARGLFSNESGLGSAPIVAAAAQTRNPVRQALVSSTGTFWDTVVVCLMTGLVVVSSGLWKSGLAADGTMKLKPDGSPVIDSAALVHDAFHAVGSFGPWVLTIGLLTFVFSTILGWCYYGEKATEYLLGPRSVKPYRLLWVLAVLFGSTQTAQAVWDFSDAANGLMALPNLICLICLSGVIAAETRSHQHELSGKD